MADEGQAVIVAPRRMNIDWPQFMSLLMQALEPFDCVKTTQVLQRDLPRNLQPMNLAHLRAEFLGGFYEKCAETLSRINGLTREHVSGAMVYIVLLWYLERSQDRFFPVSNCKNYAGRLLREDVVKLQNLVLGISPSLGDLNDFPVLLELRKYMLKRLELVLPSPVQNLNVKLLKLKKYGTNAQIDYCLSHNKENVNPLYCDHLCSENHLPTKTIQLLTGHQDEVRCVKFSHNGLYLASGSFDCTAIIWEIEAEWEFINKHVLRGHREAIFSVSWSPNDELLLTCAPQEHIKMWDVFTGQCIRVISQEDQVLSSCVFFNSDPIEIVYGRSKRSGSIRFLSDDNDYELVAFPRAFKGRWKVDLAVTLIGDESDVIYYDPDDLEGTFTILDIGTRDYRSFKEGVAICGISVSEDGHFLILNLINNEIHVWNVWNLWRLMDRPLIYWNFKQICDGNTPCFGGVDSRFIVTGTQDAKVCIWNRKQARPIAVLSGHKSAVSCVSWNPVRPQMLASASDDSTIRIWGPKSQPVPHLFLHG